MILQTPAGSWANGDLVGSGFGKGVVLGQLATFGNVYIFSITRRQFDR
jgi:hypothetical protein